MKLFKSLLVAPATLGLLAPMSATANEVTINDFNPAEELAITNSRVDGLEARLNNFEAGSFLKQQQLHSVLTSILDQKIQMMDQLLLTTLMMQSTQTTVSRLI